MFYLSAGGVLAPPLLEVSVDSGPDPAQKELQVLDLDAQGPQVAKGALVAGGTFREQ